MGVFILDVNIVFGALLSKKQFYQNIFSSNTFYTPDFALLELNKYRNLLETKAKIKPEILKEFTLFIFSKIIVVPDYVISKSSYNKALSLCKDIDEKDTPYVALAIEMNLPLLTSDKKLCNGLVALGNKSIVLFDDFMRNNNDPL